MGCDQDCSPGYRLAVVWAKIGSGALALAAELVLVGAIPTAISAQQSGAAPGSLVFDGVTVVDVEQGRLLPAQRVVITGNRIQAVGDVGAIKVPHGAQLVDAQGKYVIPGLWDMHIHPGRAADLFHPLLLANGVTGIRDAGSAVPLDTQRLWRREILAGARVGPPRQIFSGRYIDGNFNEGCSRGEEFAACVTDSADAVHYVDSLKATGADMIKLHDNGLTPQVYFVVAAEARRRGILFGGHVPEGMSPMEASDSGASILDHLRSSQVFLRCGQSLSQCQPIAERLRRNGTWFAPTLWIEVMNLRERPLQGFPLGYTTSIFDRVRDGLGPKSAQA